MGIVNSILEHTGNLLTGGFTLLGVFLGGYIQNKTLERRAKEEQRRTRREKAELVLGEVAEAINWYNDRTAQAIKLFSNPTDPGAYIPNTALDRVWALTAVYFPSQIALVDKFRELNAELLSEASDQIRKEVEKADLEVPNAMSVAGWHALYAFDLRDAALQFGQDFRRAIQDEVKSLW